MKNELTSKGIETHSYKDLRNIMSSKKYKDFISKIDNILDYFNYSNLNEI